jgi:ribosomal protein S18 acetylase RimI-like enzyme
MAPSQTSLVIRTLEPHEWPAYRDIRLRSLADAPDAFCSTLADEQARSPDLWAARLSAAAVSGRDAPFVAELAGAVVGLLWAQLDAADPAVANLYQVWVAPENRGHGVAARLLQQAIAWAKSRNATLVQLSVTSGDTAAVRLYSRAGFQMVGAPLPRRPGLPLLEQSMALPIAPGSSGAKSAQVQ